MHDSAETHTEGEGELSVFVTRALLEEYLALTEKGPLLTENEKEQFISIALFYQLNPFKRELHAKVSNDNGARRFVLIVGYEVYIKKAERTGKLDGWKAWIEGAGDNLKAVVEIHRRDWDHPFLHEAYWVEAVQRWDDGTITDFWERMPRFQLKKVAISQGFRLCFSDEIGGIPYDPSELSFRNEEKFGTASSTENRSKPTTCGQGNDLSDQIHDLVMANKDLFSESHLEWIVNQLRLEKTQPQLMGLLKHVKATIEHGGDEERDSPAPHGNVRNGSRMIPDVRRDRSKTSRSASGAVEEGIVY